MVPPTRRRVWVALLIVGALALAGASGAFADPGGPNGEAVGYSGQGADHASQPNGPPPEDPESDHPSGKSRDVEPGGSEPQGTSESEPDNDGRGPDRLDAGLDKPGGGGGEDDDWDGNNGCGNDTDFNDDNEGWCGKPVETAPVVTVAEEEEEREARTDVLGVVTERKAEAVEAEVAGAELGRTGADVLPLIAIGFGQIVTGFGFRILARRRR